MLRALIVDDDAHMRFLIRMTIEVGADGFGVSGEVDSGPAALAAVQADRPDVVVLDNWMPGMSGLQVAEQLLAADPHQAIVLFSAALDAATVAAAKGLGIRACLQKTEIDALADVLRAAAAGA